MSQRATRGYYAGNLRSFDNAEGERVYGFDIYTDPTNDDELLTLQEMEALYNQLAASMQLRPLVYSPVQSAAQALATSWVDPAFPIDYPAQAASPDYEAYITGQTYGIVRLFTLEDLIEAAEDGELSRQDIIIVDSAPTDLESIVAGTITGSRQGDLSHLNIRAARRGTPKESYSVGNGEVLLQLNLSNIHADEFNLRWLDAENLTQRIRITGELRDADGNVESRLSLAPCGYTTLPLITYDVTLSDGQRMTIQQRRERDDGVSGLAALAHAEVTLAAGSRTLSDYGQLIYAADRHHWNEQFWLLFDEPLGDAHGVGLYQQYTGSGEPIYSAVLLDSALETLREVEIIEVTRVDQSLSDGSLIFLDLSEESELEQIAVNEPSNLTIACPSGVVCDADYTYRAHTYSDEQVYMYMSFGPEIVDNYSLSSLVEHFNYLNLRITFPERVTSLVYRNRVFSEKLGF